MASIQTMPAQVNFVGNRGSVQRQIGNAVPSLLSEVIARSIRNQLFDSPLRGTLTHSIRTKRPIPAPEPVQPVPKKYLNLLGHHPDHPGSQSPRGKLR
jgi:DNA (cytosine-5)-methyltransferase 1